MQGARHEESTRGGTSAQLPGLNVLTFRSHPHSVIYTEEGWDIAPEDSVSFLERTFPPASQEYYALKHL